MSRLTIEVGALSGAAKASLVWQLTLLLRHAVKLRCSRDVTQRINTALRVAKSGSGTVRIERGMPRAPRTKSTGRPDQNDRKRNGGHAHQSGRPLAA